MFLSFQFSGWKLSLHFDPSFALPGRFPDRCCFLYLPLLSIIVAISRSLKGWYGRHRDRSWCSQISTRGPGMLNTQACSFREGMHRPVIHPEDGQQMWLIALWPLRYLCGWEHTGDGFPPPPLWACQSIEPAFMDRVVYGQSVELAFTEKVFTNSFQVVTSLGLLCTRDLIITGKLFTKLYCA